MLVRYLLVGGLALTGLLSLSSASPRPQAAPQAPAKEQPAASFTKQVQPFLAKHCFACHGNGKKRAGLSLDKYKDEAALQKDRQVWENVLHMVRTGEMPPKERPRPDVKEIEVALGAVEGLLNQLDCTKERNVGRVPLRRLNRAEYNNTIRDLVGVDFKPAADFPADDLGDGFDNSISPLLLERYLAAAEAILDQAIVIVDPPRATTTRLAGLRVSRGAGDIPKRGTPFLYAQGEVFALSNLDPGDYVVRAEVSAQLVGDEPVRGVLRVGGKDLQAFALKTTQLATVEAKIRLTGGTARLAVAFLNPFADPKAADPQNRQRQLRVRAIVVDGPHNPPPPVLPAVHQKLMAHQPGLAPREAAREILTRFAARAFRRPVTAAEVERLLVLFDRGQKDGERFERCVRLALYRVLVSPHFLYRVERDPPDAQPGKAYPVGDHALASRLSYFLWSTMPDEELFALAAKGQLRRNLEAQVRRMLEDRKSAAFVENFAGQWLTLRNLLTVSPDPKAFPEFDESLRTAMYRETELLFDAVLRENRSILDFLDADFTFVNERLAKHYGIAGVKGSAFQRVQVPANRGGILTHASILTLTSYPTRTSPVLRGKWVLEQIFNTPPPPPPPDVPELGDTKELKGSLRQMMEQHRKNPGCASCHQRMDPLGFAFEHYDAIGRWRDRDGKFAIDAAGVLPDGKAFKGPAELTAILKDKKALFGRALTEKVLTYALGRSLEFHDKCAVDDVLKRLAQNDYRLTTLLVEVAKSEPFQKRTAIISRGQAK